MMILRWLVLGAGLTAGAALPGAELAPAPPKVERKGSWVALFDGKTLKAWKAHPKSPAKWKVEKGLLVGSGKAGYLFSELGDYTDFHFRVEASINDGGDSGQFCRAAYGPGFPGGYQAQINATRPTQVYTGSLYPVGDMATHFDKIVVPRALHKADEWFTQEVVCVGPTITILVNGKKTVEWKDPKWRHKKGHL